MFSMRSGLAPAQQKSPLAGIASAGLLPGVRLAYIIAPEQPPAHRRGYGGAPSEDDARFPSLLTLSAAAMEVNARHRAPYRTNGRSVVAVPTDATSKLNTAEIASDETTYPRPQASSSTRQLAEERFWHMADYRVTAGQASEDQFTASIEQYTSQLPSSAYLGLAIASILGSVSFQLAGKKHEALFVGQWVAPFLLLGIYNKMVKQHGSDAETRS